MAWGTVLAITVPVVLLAAGGAGYYIVYAPRVVETGTDNGRDWRVSRVRTNGPLSVGYQAEVNEAPPGFGATWRYVGNVIYADQKTARAAALERIAQISAPGFSPGAPAVTVGTIVAGAASVGAAFGTGATGSPATGWPEGYCYNASAGRRLCVKDGVWIEVARAGA